MKRMNFPSRKQDRREQAGERQEERNNRTLKQQLQSLRSRGHGHCKEAESLDKVINAEKEKKRHGKG